jgi:hypothetical protein
VGRGGQRRWRQGTVALSKTKRHGQEIFFYQIAAPVCQSRTCTGELRLVPLPVALSATMSKDEEPFTGFNKRELHGTLVGNWVEERQLESDTGVFRYKVRLPATPEFRGIIIIIIPFWPLPRRGSPRLTRSRPHPAELGPRFRRVRPRDVGPDQARAHGDVRARGQARIRPAAPPMDHRRAVPV